LNRAGKFLYVGILVLAVPALTAYTVWLPRLRFSDADERLFRAARHGDRPAIEQSLADGATVTAVAPIDGKTALFRAATFGQADAVRLLLDRGADPAAIGNDGRSPIDVVLAARAEEKDPAAGRALDAVAALLRSAGAGR
jgi:ankyrin repeat protein